MELRRTVANDKAAAQFSTDLAAVYLPTRERYWSATASETLPGQPSLDWLVPAGASTDRLFDDLAEVIDNYLYVALEAVTDRPEFPAEGRTWPRSFVSDPNEDLPLAAAVPRSEWPSPPSPDEAMDYALNADFSSRSALEALRRSQAVAVVYRSDRGDPRCLGILLAYLEREPNTGTRAAVAKALGFADFDANLVLPSLRAALSDDSGLRVRLNAAYAIRLIERRQPASA